MHVLIAAVKVLSCTRTVAGSLGKAKFDSKCSGQDNGPEDAECSLKICRCIQRRANNWSKENPSSSHRFYKPNNVILIVIGSNAITSCLDKGRCSPLNEADNQGGSNNDICVVTEHDEAKACQRHSHTSHAECNGIRRSKARPDESIRHQRGEKAMIPTE
jgi:hypothetical protein